MDREYPTDVSGRRPAAAANFAPDSGVDTTGSPADVAAALVARLLSDAGRALTLEGTGIGDEGAAALAEELRQLLSLTRLNLGANKLGSVGAAALAPALAQLTGLTALGFGGNNIGSAGAASLAPALRRLTGVMELNLNGNNIGDAGVASLVPALGRLPCLAWLGLNGNEIGDTGVSCLAPVLQELAGLTRITLADNRIGDAGVAALAPTLATLTKLTDLWLSFNKIGDAGAMALAPALAQLTDLAHLHLNNNGITDTGKAALIQSFLKSRGTQRTRREVMWPLVTPGSLKLAGLPRGLAASWGAFDAFMIEAFAPPGLCTDGVHASVVLVGHEGAGKTTLAAKLATGTFRDDTTPTVGLATSTEVWEAEAGLKLRLVDCGGHLEYAATHPFFFTDAAVYVVVWSARQPQKPGIERYLQSVVARVPDALVVVVQSRVDEEPTACAPPVATLAEQFPSARLSTQVVRVSSKDGTGIEALAAAVASRVRRLPHIASPLPTTYARLGPELRRMRTSLVESGSPPLMPESLVLTPEVVSRCGFQSLAVARQALRLYHSLGEVLHSGCLGNGVVSGALTAYHGSEGMAAGHSSGSKRPPSHISAASTPEPRKEPPVPVKRQRTGDGPTLGVAGLEPGRRSAFASVPQATGGRGERKGGEPQPSSSRAIGGHPADDMSSDPIVVLSPQWLADRFAAVVRHDSTSIQALADGVVEHGSLCQLLDPSSVGDASRTALVNILHGLGVAFPLRSRDGAPLTRSVIPAILPLTMDEDILQHAFPKTVRRHRASFRNANAAIVRVFTRHTFTLLDDARTTFVPLDLMPRLMCRAHAVAAVRKLGGVGGGMPLVWRDGCVYELGSGCVATLSLEEQHLLIDVRGEYPHYLWRCLVACVDAVAAEYDASSMACSLKLLCPRCGEFVTRLDGGRAARHDTMQCQSCDHEVEVSCMATLHLGVASSADDVCDRLLRQLGYRVQATGQADGDGVDEVPRACPPDQLLDVRRAVLASAEATIARVGSVLESRRDAQPRSTNDFDDDVIDNSQQPRCWLAFFNHSTDDGAGVTLHPVCEHPQHVHACVEAALRAAGVGVAGGDAVELPVLTGGALERCAPYLWRMACLVDASLRNDPDSFPHGLAEAVSATRRRLAALMAARVGRSDAVEPDWSWPGCEVDLTCGSTVLRRRTRRCGHEPGGCVWECLRSPSNHPPARPTRYARRLAVVVGVSEYAALCPVPRARGDAEAVGALLSSGADFESVLRGSSAQTGSRVQWPFGCLGFNRAHDNVEVTETTPEAWRDSNVCVIVDDEALAPVRDRLDHAVEGMIEAAVQARKQAIARCAAADRELETAMQQLTTARSAGAGAGAGAHSSAGAGAGAGADTGAGVGTSAGTSNDFIAAAESRVRACEEAAEEAREVAEAGCMLLLYFSGHGAVGRDRQIVLYVGPDGSGGRGDDTYHINAALDALAEYCDWSSAGAPEQHCFVALVDCCPVTADDVGHRDFAEPQDADATAADLIPYAAHVMVTSPRSGASSGHHRGAFSRMTELLLAELPVRGVSWPVIGGRVAQRSTRLEVESRGMHERMRLQQWQGNARQGDVL